MAEDSVLTSQRTIRTAKNVPSVHITMGSSARIKMKTNRAKDLKSSTWCHEDCACGSCDYYICTWLLPRWL